MVFTYEKSKKPIADMRSIILAIIETLGELDALANFIYYKEILQCTPLISSIEEEKVTIIPPKFLNHPQHFFHNLKKKNKGGHQYVKCYMIYTILIDNICETLKDEYTEFKLWLQP